MEKIKRSFKKRFKKLRKSTKKRRCRSLKQRTKSCSIFLKIYLFKRFLTPTIFIIFVVINKFNELYFESSYILCNIGSNKW
ncbi:hypothetical protein GJ496_000352 [Pomphorhynchus laevis]|nr:hypothetical protein GJ496_000352 [Pomphorhynchus laevis]